MALEAGSRRVVADGTNSAERLEPDVAASTRPNRRKAPAAKNRSKQQLRPRVLVIFQGHRGDRESIDRRLVTAVSDQLVRHIETPREHTCLDVWLETPGGDAHVVYKLVLLLRSYASRLRVIIPDYAKSAGTLLAIAADEIYMAPAAELGPLDAQIGYEKEGMTISALDMARSLEDLAETAMIMALSLDPWT